RRLAGFAAWPAGAASGLGLTAATVARCGAAEAKVGISATPAVITNAQKPATHPRRRRLLALSCTVSSQVRFSAPASARMLAPASSRIAAPCCGDPLENPCGRAALAALPVGSRQPLV